MKIAVITVSDRAFAGEFTDKSGPAIEEIFATALPDSVIEKSLVPDGQESVFASIKAHAEAGADWIITTGGTGPAPRDQTPEAARAFCDRDLPGLAEYLRTESLKETPNAVFSRLFSGMKDSVFVVNVPGSERAARFCAALIAPLMNHGLKMAKGEGH